MYKGSRNCLSRQSNFLGLIEDVYSISVFVQSRIYIRNVGRVLLLVGCLCILYLPLSFQLVLVSPTAKQYDLLLRHLRERIYEGCGETIYVVGMASGKGISFNV